MKDFVLVRPEWIFEARDKYGYIKWRSKARNMIVDAGANYMLNVSFVSATQITGWYVGLTDSTPVPAQSDTMGAHSGWTEFTTYTEGARQGWNLQSSTSRVVTNSASKAVFTISSDAQTVGGAFISDSSTKGGTTGTLYAVAANPSGDQTFDTGETLTVLAAYTIS